MTPRTISYAATCLAAAATLSAAFAGSARAMMIAAPACGASLLAAVLFAALHWDDKRRAARESISSPDVDPDLTALTDCPWCKDTSVAALASQCRCKVPCDGIAWCDARPRAADLETSR